MRNRNFVRRNFQIRAREIRVIGADGALIGVMAPREAVKIANEAGLDLVEISPNAKPPVCKITDYGKYKYELQKKAKEAKKRQVIVLVKEIKLRAKTEDHDLEFKLRHIERFLAEGNKAKITVKFRGRELAHKNLGREMLDKIAKKLEEVGSIEQFPKMEGRNMTMLIAPKT